MSPQNGCIHLKIHFSQDFTYLGLHHLSSTYRPCSLIYKGHFHSNYNMVVFTIKQEQAACSMYISGAHTNSLGDTKLPLSTNSQFSSLSLLLIIILSASEDVRMVVFERSTCLYSYFHLVHPFFRIFAFFPSFLSHLYFPLSRKLSSLLSFQGTWQLISVSPEAKGVLFCCRWVASLQLEKGEGLEPLETVLQG